MVTFVSALPALHRGQAQQLFFGDIVEDPEDWVNRSVADVYGKEAILLKREDLFAARGKNVITGGH